MPSSKTSATKVSSRRLRLQVLSQILDVRADSPVVLHVLGFQFRHFVAPPGVGPASHRVVLQLAGPSPALSVNRLRRELPRNSTGTRHALAMVFEAILDSLRGQLLFHAGVVSAGNRGMLICGPPGFGKTSLVLELADRGFGFLSDDYAPVALDSGWVSPFPRSLGIVAASRIAVRRLRGVPRSHRLLHDDKWLVDPEGIPGLRLGGPCRPEVVLLLGPCESLEASSAGRYEIAVSPDRVEELHQILSEASVRPQRRSAGSRGRVYRFSLPRGMNLAVRLQEWAYANRSSVYSLTRLFPRAGAFRPPLRVHPVSGKDGLIEVLSDLQNRRPASEGSGQPGGSPARLLMQSASLLGRASFYRFEGGDLASRAEAAAGILRSEPAVPRGRDDSAG